MKRKEKKKNKVKVKKNELPGVQQRHPRDQVFGVPWPYVLRPLVTIVIPPRGIESGAGGGEG